jgi:phosphate transport system substrate-binding protein
MFRFVYILISACILISCGPPSKEEVTDTPTAGNIKVYYSEGLELHIKNQAYTFEALYGDAKVKIIPAPEDEAIQQLLKDSCKGIIIHRLLGENEKKAFEQKGYFPKYSALAKTGVALIVNKNSPIEVLTRDQVLQLLSDKIEVKDSLGKSHEPNAIFDNQNSSVTRYLLDTLLLGKKFGAKCSATQNSLELINTIASNPNAIGFIDFAWLSDRDDSLFKAHKDKIRFVAVAKDKRHYAEPNQSSFKTGEYPFTRTIYFLRTTGDFTLAKGFESFMAGPKGQLIFLKQGLLPHRQGERNIEVKMEPLAE